jgi:hypothetical protein
MKSLVAFLLLLCLAAPARAEGDEWVPGTVTEIPASEPFEPSLLSPVAGVGDYAVGFDTTLFRRQSFFTLRVRTGREVFAASVTLHEDLLRGEQSTAWGLRLDRPWGAFSFATGAGVVTTTAYRMDIRVDRTTTIFAEARRLIDGADTWTYSVGLDGRLAGAGVTLALEHTGVRVALARDGWIVSSHFPPGGGSSVRVTWGGSFILWREEGR